MADLETKVISALTKKRHRLATRLTKRGGRGVGLAETIDRLDCAIAALNGELQCPHCEAVLTSSMESDEE